MGIKKEVREMVTLFVRHQVKEFGAWKAAYNAFDEERKTMGVTSHAVYQSEDNPNEVTLYHEFKNLDSAKAFLDSSRLKEVMEMAGVASSPDIWFGKQV